MASEETFRTALGRVLAFEGGYANDPADPGGETNFGISKRSYPGEDIRGITIDRAVDIYRRDFWHATRIDQLSDVCAGACLDLSVNMGPKAAVSLVQAVLVQGGASLVVDGVLGPATIAASVRADAMAFGAGIRWHAVERYLAIVDRKPSSRRYLSGWLRRACALI